MFTRSGLRRYAVMEYHIFEAVVLLICSSRNSGAKSASFSQTIVPNVEETEKFANIFLSFKGSKTGPQSSCSRSTSPESPLLNLIQIL